MRTVFETAALAAGRVIMEIFHNGIEVSIKADKSPVTEADRMAEEVILSLLQTHFPDIPVIAEEQVSTGLVPPNLGTRFFLVDPLDGTKEFINRREDFTVNIALIENGVPVRGVVYAPARHVLYYGDVQGATKSTVSADFRIVDTLPITARRPPVVRVAVASRSHMTPETATFLAEQNISAFTSVGSSLKFCLVAEGNADLYPRFGRTMEWDTAAGDAVLRAAGGQTSMLDGATLLYGKLEQLSDTDFANPYFIARGKV